MRDPEAERQKIPPERRVLAAQQVQGRRKAEYAADKGGMPIPGRGCPGRAPSSA